MTARSCPTCRGITTTPRLIEHDGQGAFPCPDRWHTVTALLDDQGRETPTANLPGFDPADPSTWHPMHGTVASPMQRAYKMLGVRPGTDMAPAIDHLARTLFPPGEDTEADTLRAELADVRRVLDEQCEVNATLSREVGRLRIVETASIGAHALLDDANDEIERLQCMLTEALVGWQSAMDAANTIAGGETLPVERVAEIRREAGLS